MMKVTEPTDRVGLDYALDELITEARESDIDDKKIRERLSAYERAIERGDV